MEEENRDSINLKNDSVVSESQKALHEEIKENRKFMNFVFRNLNQKKGISTELLHKECFEVLRASDKDLTKIYDGDRNNFVHLCVREEKLEYLKAIVDAYSLILDDKEKFYDWFSMENSDNMTGLDIAAQFANKEIIKYLFEIYKRTNESRLKLSENRNNIFHYAAKANQCFPIIFFYEKLNSIFSQRGVNLVNSSNQFGISPLHYACYFGSRKVIDLLLDLGAEINARDSDGATCLHYAISRGCVRIVKKLLLRGVDKKIKKHDGKTAYDLALDSNHHEIARILEKKNICKRYLCMDSGIEPFKESRNDLYLFLILFFVVILKLIYIFKIESILQNDSNLNFSLNNANKKSTSDLKDLLTCTLDQNCIFETLTTFLSLIFDLFTMAVLVYFMCWTGNFRSQKKVRSNYSLIELYENNQNVCVICKVRK